MSNENFRRELGHVFDEMTGSPSSALPDRVRSSVERAPEQRAPFWIAGVAAGLIAAMVVGILVVANLRGQPAIVPVGPVAASPSPLAGSSAGPSPSSTPSADTSLPAFSCATGAGFTFKQGTSLTPPIAFIDQVRIGTHSGYDRITIEFNNGLPGDIDVSRQSDASFTQGASGRQVTLKGVAGVLITIKGADEHTAFSGPVDLNTAYPVLLEARQVQDFEGTVQWALGLSRSACYRAFVLDNPSRLVIDVQTP